MTINQKNVDTWVAALRSGEYEQTTKALGIVLEVDQWGTPSKCAYCCLGVGETLINEPDEREEWEESQSLTFEHQENFPGPDFMDWIGVRFPEGEHGEPDEDAELDPKLDLGDNFTIMANNTVTESVFYDLSCSVMNDTWRLTHAQIADMIAYFGLKEWV